MQLLFRSASKPSMISPKPRVVISVPSGITEVEERTVINAAIEAGARRVYLIEEPLAAAMGAGLDISGPNGHMVVDIGGGTTDIAVLTMNGVASSASLKTAGIAFDEAIARYIRRRHGIVIGQVTAEDIKIQIGSVYPQQEATSMLVKGRDAKAGIPREIEIHSSEILEVLRRPALHIVEEVLSVLEDSSPELVGDISENGIVLSGGGSLLYGMAQLITERTGIEAHIVDDALSCTAYGAGRMLSRLNNRQDGMINLARNRQMKG